MHRPMDFTVAGEPAHTRCLDLVLRQAEEGRLAFRGDLLDLRKGGFMDLAGHLASAGIIHRMEIHGEFDAATGVIESIGWEQTHVAHESNDATGGECCRDPMQRLEGLVGTTFGSGFVSGLKQHFGGPLGCTHINTLFQQTSALIAGLKDDEQGWQGYAESRQPGDRIASRSVFLDGVGLEGGEAVDLCVRVSDLTLAEVDPAGNEQLASHDELRLVATVEFAGWSIRAMRAAERCRAASAFDDAEWVARTPEVEDFAGQSLAGGMARTCLERFGGEPANARLLSALLSLAPGMTQVPASLTDSIAPSRGGYDGSQLAGPGPCYMLRAGGPLMESLRSRMDSDS